MIVTGGWVGHWVIMWGISTWCFSFVVSFVSEVGKPALCLRNIDCKRLAFLLHLNVSLGDSLCG